MSLNYHELTMNEPRDSPARRKQFLVICVIGVGIFLNTLVNSGGFHTVVIEEGVVPDGQFVFKSWSMDYAGAMSKVRCAVDDVNMDPYRDEQGDLFYNLFLDEPAKTPSGATRFLVGGLSTTTHGSGDTTNDDVFNVKEELIKFRTNKQIVPRREEFCDDRDYEVGDVPIGVKAGVAQFPFTDGFVSALILTYKVIPAMIRHGKKHGVENPVTFTTCSLSQYMCSHYVPLEQNQAFLFGRLNTDEYVKTLAEIEAAKRNQDAIDYAAVWRGIKKLSPL